MIGISRFVRLIRNSNQNNGNWNRCPSLIPTDLATDLAAPNDPVQDWFEGKFAKLFYIHILVCGPKCIY
jgi:hypothetical protein